jgi:hypothetical protein
MHDLYTINQMNQKRSDECKLRQNTKESNMFPEEDINHEQFVIFETHLTETETREELVRMMIPFKVVEGKYKGKVSPAFVVNHRHFARLGYLVVTQESVLILSEVLNGGLRVAEIVDVSSGEAREIGFFNPSTEVYAKSRENYTYDFTSNQYFVAE